MPKSIVLLSLLFFHVYTHAQNIYSALHLNEEREYKTKKPKKIIEKSTFYNSSSTEIEKNVKLFDDAGMIVEEQRFDENEKLTARLTFTNDTVNKIVLTRTFERWGALGYQKETAFYDYDSTKHLIRITDKEANGNVTGISEIVCNDKGDPVELATFDRKGHRIGKEVATYFYNSNKVTTAVVTNEGQIFPGDTNKISFIKAYKFPANSDSYNSHGDAVTWVSKSLDGSRTIYNDEYTYDREGNCTEEKIFKVTVKENGRQKRKMDRDFRKEYFY